MIDIINTKKIDELKEYKFRIPLYQREYAWGEDEVEQLIEDLKTFQEKQEDRQYFLGNIVLDKINDNFYDVIDGQQRLTTLYLLTVLLKKDVYELYYEIREEDDKFLKSLKNLLDKNTIEELKRKFKNINSNFLLNIETIRNKLKDISDNLLNNVILTLTIIPKDVDVVKYFEVMNNRGKQLEKHQILKAKFLQVLKEENSINWAKIWDYCSYINSPIEDLIYYNLPKNEKSENKVEEIRRNLLNFEYEGYFSDEEKEDKKKISELLSDNEDKNFEKEINSRYEYRSIVKFPIFLIHVLKIFITLEKRENFKNLDEIKVNDKYLLDFFHKDKAHNEFLFDKNLAKEFMELMLKLRIFFDYFIIKRDEEDKPIIFRNDDNNLKMIELLFINSAPQYFAQHWIGVFLKWLYENRSNLLDIDEKATFKNQGAIKFLETFDKEFALIRLNDEKIFEFIDKKIEDIKEKEVEIKKDLDEILNKVLNKGTLTPHYWFYKLDYLLWKNYCWNQNFSNKFEENEKFKYSNIKEQFRLTRLHSIEHIHPQSKKETWECNKCEGCEENCIDCFGNLALISNHLNSALLDKDYNDKRLKIQEQLNHGTIESLKLLLVYSKYPTWNEENCKKHYNEMIELLKKSLNLQNPTQ